jgi:hypothetical protein
MPLRLSATVQVDGQGGTTVLVDLGPDVSAVRTGFLQHPKIRIRGSLASANHPSQWPSSLGNTSSCTQSSITRLNKSRIFLMNSYELVVVEELPVDVILG